MNITDEISSSVNKAIPPLRQDDLNEYSTRFDHISAAPPNSELVKYWYSWAVLAYGCGLFSMIVCSSIVVNKKVREKPFNLYLIYLMIPDFVFSMLCGTTCLLNAIKGSYWSHSMCNFQQFYVVFGIGANAWLNSIIAHQLHSILRHSSARRRYRLPTRKQVTIHSIAVYAWCFFLGSWGIYESEKFPFQSGQASGLACLPLEGTSTVSVIFFWLCFFPLFAGIPVLYVGWICWDIYKRKLMPPPGQRRLFTIYFGRLIIVFLVMWIPTILVIFILSPWLPQWVDFMGGTWSHLQGGLSAFLVLLKPDIQNAFWKFTTCRWHVKDGNFEDDTTRPTSSGMLSSGNRSSYWWPRQHSGNISLRRDATGSSANLGTGFEGIGLEDDIEGGKSTSEKPGSEIFQESNPSGDLSRSGTTGESTPELCDNGDNEIVLENGDNEIALENGDHVIAIKG